MWHLTRLALQKRAATILLAALLVVASIWAVLGLNMELIPDIQFPYMTVVTVYPEASPDEVASQVTTPIEDAVWDRWEGKGLKHLNSTSTDSVSLIFAEFEFGTNMDEVTSTVQQDVSKLNLPPEVLSFPQMNPSMGENPRIVPIDLSMLPVVIISLSGDLPPDQLKEVADTQIVPALKDVPGVLSVETEGGAKDQVLVAPDPARMNQFDISMARVVGLLASNYSSLDEIRNTPLGTDGVVLGDVADVGQGPAPMAVVTRTNGKPSVTITVMKKDEANTVAVANAVVARAEELERGLSSGAELAPVFDQSDFIEDSISTLWEKALVGGGLAIIVVFLFLAAFRASLVTAISIPLSMLIGFLAMRAFGLTINLLTLSAMSIAVGRLIDDSIVMVEVIYRRLQRGEPLREAAINGAREIANPITSATLATVTIFLPLIFVGGIVGELFIPFALTVTFAVLASLAVALMVVPTLSNFLVSGKAKVRVKETFYQKAYTPALKWVLGHRALTLTIAAVLFIGSLGLLPLIGTSFLSGLSEKSLTVDIQLPPGTNIRVTSETAAQVEALLVGNKAIENYYTTVGTSTSLMGAMSTASGGGNNTAQISVYLTPAADMDREADALRLACKGIAGGDSIAVSTSESSGGAGMGFSGLDISVQGDNQEDLANTTRQLVARLEGIGGLANLESELTMVVPRLDIQLDPSKLAASGLPPQQLQQEFYLLMMGGNMPGKVANINGESYPIFVKGVASGLGDVTEARAITIGWPKSVALGDVAKVALLERPTHISHTDRKLSAGVGAAITDKNVGAVNEAVQKEIDALPPHPGVEIKMGGVQEMMGESFSNMRIAIFAAIVIAYLVVAVMTRSLLNPLIIMVSLPLASIGALLGLLISGNTLGVSALMGVLMLIGIVLTNAIVLIALVEQLRRGGKSTHDALIEGGKTRLRPILMTALATILALIPLAVGVGSGTIIAAELGVVVIGGLFSSTLLTLLVIPVIYSLVHRSRREPASS
ncbi:MAG: efflux RND transporter permease subunit [Chloroflexota bacterium]